MITANENYHHCYDQVPHPTSETSAPDQTLQQTSVKLFIWEKPLAVKGTVDSAATE